MIFEPPPRPEDLQDLINEPAQAPPKKTAVKNKALEQPILPNYKRTFDIYKDMNIAKVG